MSQFKIFGAAAAQNQAGAEKVSHEGGVVYRASDGVLFERFLILGTFGTFYASASELAEKHTHQAREFITSQPEAAMDILEDVVSNRLAFRRDPSLFAMAAMTLPHAPIWMRRRVATLMSEHVITGTDILHWAAYRKMLGGKWNKTTRGIVNNWFLRQRTDLALQAVKYQQRDGWSLRDLARLAHPSVRAGVSKEIDQKRTILDFIAHPDKRKDMGFTDIPLIDAYNYTRTGNMNDDTVAAMIRGARLPREAVESKRLQSSVVWDALMDDMPGQALLRNLGKLTSMGVAEARITDVERKITNAANRVHPMQFLVAWNQYTKGHGEKGKLTWKPLPSIEQALIDGYKASFGQLKVNALVKPLIALDVSGSMTSPAMGLPMSCIAVELCMVEVLAHQFPNAVFAAYSNAGVPSTMTTGRWGFMRESPESLPIVNVKGKSRFDLGHEIENYTRSFAGTDCAIPLRMAEKDRSIDAVISITDSETGFGESPAAVIERIYEQGRTEFRHAVVGLSMNDLSIAAPNDVRQMDVVGASANLPQVLERFVSQSGADDRRYDPEF